MHRDREWDRDDEPNERSNRREPRREMQGRSSGEGSWWQKEHSHARRDEDEYGERDYAGRGDDRHLRANVYRDSVEHRGYGERGYGERGYGDHGHADRGHADRGYARGYGYDEGRFESQRDYAGSSGFGASGRPSLGGPETGARGAPLGFEHEGSWRPPDVDHGAHQPTRRTSFSGRGPRGYTRSDERIREEVCEALTEHDEIDPSEVDITVNSGEVTLSGLVDERRMKRLAEDVAASCRGVKDVHNQIRVRQEPQRQTREQIPSGPSASQRTGPSERSERTENGPRNRTS